MDPNVRVKAQATVILGFALTAVSQVVNYFMTVTSRGYAFNSFREDVIPILEPLITIAVVFAWWWLTRIDVENGGHRRILQFAFLAFAVQYLLTTILFLFIVTPFQSFGGFWETSQPWLQLVGAFVSCIGLFVLSRTLSARFADDRELPEARVVGLPQS
jgi:hypothetical protein